MKTIFVLLACVLAAAVVNAATLDIAAPDKETIETTERKYRKYGGGSRGGYKGHGKRGGYGGYGKRGGYGGHGYGGYKKRYGGYRKSYYAEKVYYHPKPSYYYVGCGDSCSSHYAKCGSGTYCSCDGKCVGEKCCSRGQYFKDDYCYYPERREERKRDEGSVTTGSATTGSATTGRIAVVANRGLWPRGVNLPGMVISNVRPPAGEGPLSWRSARFLRLRIGFEVVQFTHIGECDFWSTSQKKCKFCGILSPSLPIEMI